MATNEILAAVSTDTGTNLLTQAEYVADAQRLIGNQPGIARAKLVNKMLRQSSLLAAAVAQLIADSQPDDVVDTLSVAALEAMLKRTVGFVSNGVVTTVNAANSPFALTADHAGLVIMDATAGNVVANLPAVNVIAQPLRFNFVRIDATANTATVNRAGADTFVGGATSFTLTGQGDARAIQGDAASKWAPVSETQHNGSLQGKVTYNASAVLVFGDLGKVVTFTGATAAQTLTLPPIATVPAGRTYYVVNQATVQVSVKGNAAETINANGSTGVVPANTQVLLPGTSVTFVSNGVTWDCVGAGFFDVAPVPYSGQVLQVRTIADSGGLTTNGSFTNLNGTALSITPRSNNSSITVIWLCNFQQGIAPGSNAYAYYAIFEGGTQRSNTYNYYMFSGAGGIAGGVPGTMASTMNNGSFSTRSYTIYAQTSNSLASAAAYSCLGIAIETQN